MFNTITQHVPRVCLAAALAVVGAGWTDAQAEQRAHPPGCGERDVIVRYLDQRYGETLQAAGRQSPDQIIEIYASENGSWTMIMTRPNGVSCLLAAGEDWRQLDYQPASFVREPGEPT